MLIAQKIKQCGCQHRVYKEVTEKALNADITFIGIGEVGKGCPQF